MKNLFLTALTVILSALSIGASAQDTASIQTINSLKSETIVTVAGTVESIRDEDEFILEDETGSIKIYIGPNRMPVQVGDKVTVEGMLDNDIIKREIYAYTITDAEGNVTELDRRYE